MNLKYRSRIEDITTRSYFYTYTTMNIYIYIYIYIRFKIYIYIRFIRLYKIYIRFKVYIRFIFIYIFIFKYAFLNHQLNGHVFEQTPGDGEGQGSLVFCSPWDQKELDTT